MSTFNGGITLPASADEIDNGNLTVGKNLGVGGTFDVTGVTTLKADVSIPTKIVNGNIQSGTGNLTVGNKISCHELISDYVITATDIDMNGNLNVTNGTAYFGNTVTVNSSLKIVDDIYLSTAQKLKYQLLDNRIYQPNKSCYIQCSNATNEMVQGSSSQIIYQYNFINTTYTSSLAALNLPPPDLTNQGCEITLIKCGNPAAIALHLSDGSFNISNSPFSSNYSLPASWYKISFVSLPDPINVGSYFWLQTFYQ